MAFQIYLSPPDVGIAEREALLAAFDSGWIAPVGPALTDFEAKLKIRTNQYAVLVSSGTAAIHLALLAAKVQEGDYVLVSNLTFAASVFPILYLKAIPILVASNPDTWNAEHEYAVDWLKNHSAKAAIITDLYGNPADAISWRNLAQQHNFTLIQDAAEALGSTYNGFEIGHYAHTTALSFNGNKIITTSGGGALLSHDKSIIQKAHSRATQSRTPLPWYEHKEIGYNYRMSNLLAAVGSAQLDYLSEKVTLRRNLFEKYKTLLPNLKYQQELPTAQSNRWLSVFLLPSKSNPEYICQEFEKLGIETRQMWKPMHLQPFCKNFTAIGDTSVCETLFNTGLCLPSGSNLSHESQILITKTLNNFIANT